MEAERVDVSLRLLPLLKGELQVSKIRFDRPRIRLVRGPDGWNVEDLIRPAPRPAAGERRRTEATRSVRGQLVLPIALGGALTVRDGTLVLDRPSHDKGSAPLEIHGLNVDSAAPPPNAPFRISVSGRLPVEVSGSFELTGSMRAEDEDRLPIDAQLSVRGLEAARLVSYLGFSVSSPQGLRGTVDVEVKGAGDWPHLDLQAEVNLLRLGLASEGTSVKSPGEEAWLRAKGRWDGEALDLPEANLRWKGQTITGRLQLVNLTGPKIGLDLKVPQLDIESLLGMGTASNRGTGRAEEASGRGGQRAAVANPVPVTARTGPPDGLQIEGRVRSDAVRWRGLVLTTAEGDFRYRRGVLTIQRLRGGFYGGSLSSGASLDWRGRPSRTSITAHLEGVQTEPLLKALQEERWTLSGIMTLDSNLVLFGDPGTGALARAVGHSDLVVTGGRLTGYPPLERVTRSFDPVLKGAGTSSALNEFDRLSAHWTLDKGTLRTRDLLLQREGAKLLAAGSMNLQDQRLDFDVTARVARATLEAKVSGTTTDPVVTPQVGRIEQRIKTEVGRILKGEKGEALGKVLRELVPR
jgi:AsmA protein